MQTFDLHKWSPINQCRNGRFLVCPVHDARADPDCYRPRGGFVTDYDEYL